MFFEEFKIGDRFLTNGKTITEGAITVMIGLAGFTLPLHVDEEFCKRTPYKTMLPPGRLTLFVMGALEEQTGIYGNEVMALLGLEKVRFPAPLKAGDTIHVEMEVIDLKNTKKPDRGVMVHRSKCLNQKGEIIVECEVAHLIRRKPMA